MGCCETVGRVQYYLDSENATVCQGVLQPLGCGKAAVADLPVEGEGDSQAPCSQFVSVFQANNTPPPLLYLSLSRNETLSSAARIWAVTSNYIPNNTWQIISSALQVPMIEILCNAHTQPHSTADERRGGGGVPEMR